MVKKIYRIFYEFGKQLQRDNISAYASSAAFFFFLSLVPLLLIVCSIITYTPLTENDLINVIKKIIPTAMDDSVISFVEQMYHRASTVLPIAIVVAIWSAAKGMMGLQMGLNVAHGVLESRNYFLKRLQACFYTIITVIAFAVTFAGAFFGKSFIKSITEHAPIVAPTLSFISRWRYIPVLLVLTITFLFIYTFVPNLKVKMRYQLPGAIFSAVTWVVFSWGFSVYVDNFNALSAYGSLSTIILLSFWLYFAMYILLIGANMNKYFKPVIKVFLKKKK